VPPVSPFRPDDARAVRQRAAAIVRQVAALPRLPPRVALFYLRAFWTAISRGDRWSLYVAMRPRELAEVLTLALGRFTVVEVGTGTAWTAIALALAEPGRRVTSYDIIIRPERHLYLGLVGEDVRSRLDLLDRNRARPEAGPARPDMVFIDSSHEREETVATFREWEPRLVAGGVVGFHDYLNPFFPGIAEAVEELGLEGKLVGDMFVWSKG
jgi:hypothetical protein